MVCEKINLATGRFIDKLPTVRFAENRSEYAVEPRSALWDSSVENVKRISCDKRDATYDDSLVNLRVFSSIGIIGVFRAFCAGAGSIVVITQHGAGN